MKPSGKHINEKSIPHHIPLLYSKTGVYRVIPIFVFIFVPKHRLWILVRTATASRSRLYRLHL